VILVEDSDERDWYWVNDDEVVDPPEFPRDDGEPRVGSLAFDQLLGEDEAEWERQQEADRETSRWDSERESLLVWDEEMQQGALDGYVDHESESAVSSPPDPPASNPTPGPPQIRDEDLPF
jgi:hypothetical protein